MLQKLEKKINVGCSTQVKNIKDYFSSVSHKKWAN